MLEELFDQIKLNGVYDPREQHHSPQNKLVTTSSTNERKIYGRDYEIKQLIKFLKGPNFDGNISVAPIIGLGGIGKTTLAQFVFNNGEIEKYFDNKAWVCVSDHFDRYRITKEMVDSFCTSNTTCSSFQYGSTTSLDLLERELRRYLMGKKFLLVLDDVWSDAWQQLLTPLQSAKAQAIKVIVTCRDPKVLRSTDEENKIILKGLCDRAYWSFFVNCAFGKKNPGNYSQTLHDIGKSIVGKLKGSPLAAKTVGKLLGRVLTEKHWKDVLDSDLWKLETNAHDIMPALALSYYHLPHHLQLCFVFCSVFPKNHLYHVNDLISMWIANGYIHESGNSSKTMNDTGEEYCHELLEMCFFDKYNPKSMIRMHDLMHDLAHLVSHGEICIYESGEDKEVTKNVRHLCTKDLTALGLVCKTNNLRTLVLYRVGDVPTFLNHEACKKIRVLVISGSHMQDFPDAIAHLKHLQYLDLTSTRIKSIPESLCRLYQLRVLKLRYPLILPSLFHNLINLQNWCMYEDDHKVFDERWLKYHVKRERGYVVAQLSNMNELRGELSIMDLENIDSMEEAMKAKLKEKRHIKTLGLVWNYTMDSYKQDAQEEVLEGLQPHPNLERIKISCYMGSKIPSWLMTVELHKLRKICLVRCINWTCLPAALGLLPSLEKLHIHSMENRTVECSDSVIEMFPSLKQLVLSNVAISFKGMSTPSSSSVGRRKLLPLLQYLKLRESDGTHGFHWPIYTTLEQLYIRNIPSLDDQLPRRLHGLSSLTRLELSGAKIKTFPVQVMATLHALGWLKLEDCKELLSLEGLQALPSLEKLYIIKCPKFRLWCKEEMTKLLEISLDSCQDLESLPAWLYRLPLLKQLSIKHCPKFHSLPTDALPSSLIKLNIIECDPGLMERCQQKGYPEWLMIHQIRKRSYISEDI
ncbi:P-loop containing nucleoside triphosphate hydrolase protein [Dioscorea alata]|uniref:P-loop containing nucleoside triphosphate hydrolase protein n=1 Tax=Dioscorea alata TaxID=55571 RepID=A0ACB7WKT2_DIOAL|nr:P-loop containing nucleoside triphosphate hydrolase protein [Dioscorea alata]